MVTLVDSSVFHRKFKWSFWVAFCSFLSSVGDEIWDPTDVGSALPEPHPQPGIGSIGFM